MPTIPFSRPATAPVDLIELRVDAGARCPHCKVIAYFSRITQYPSTMDAFTSEGEPISIKHPSAGQFHTATWQCLGCTGKVVLVYPNGLHQRAVKAWPIGSDRNLTSHAVPAALIPAAVRKDFAEAAMIEELAPSASAAMSRRCLQTILKDKFGPTVGSTRNLIKQVRDVISLQKLPDEIASELQGIRSIGNSAAHPNVDAETDQIIEIEPGEAAASLDVLEDLIEFLYVRPHLAAERKLAREKKHGSDNA